MGASDPKAIVVEAQKAEERGLHKEASSLYAVAAHGMRGLKRNRDAKALLKKAIELSPQSARLYVQLAIVENALGHDDSAIKAMEKFTQVAISRGKLADYRPYLEKHLASYPTLRQVFHRGLMEIDRTDAKPFLDYAKAAIEKRDWEDARAMLLDALKTQSQPEDVLTMLDSALERLGENEGRNAIQSFRARRMPLKDLLSILAKRSEGNSASRERPASAEAARDEESLDQLITRLEGEMGIELREKHDTVRPLVKEFRRRSDAILRTDPKTRIDLAMAFFQMGLVEDARSELKAIPRSDPHYREARMLTGEILYQEASYLEALEVFQGCLREEEAPDEVKVEAAYKLVQTYERLGDDVRALKWAKVLEDASPTYRDIRQLRRQIEDRIKAKS